MATVSCPNGHQLLEKSVKDSLVGRHKHKHCSQCDELLRKGVARHSCKECQFHLCRNCHGRALRDTERRAMQEAEVAECNARCHELDEQLEEAMEQHQVLMSEKEDVEDRLVAQQAAVQEEEERLKAARREAVAKEEACAESRRQALASETADEIERLEDELRRLAEEAKIHRELVENKNGEPESRGGTKVATIHLLHHHHQLLEPVQRILREEANHCHRKAAALEAERPRLEADAIEQKRFDKEEHAEVSRLRAELDRLIESDDLVTRSPGGQRSPTRRVLSTADEREAWHLEAEAEASRLRVSELEQALEQSCKRRRHDIVEGDSRARRLASVNAAAVGSTFYDDISDKPSAQVTALASGMRVERARIGPPVVANRLNFVDDSNCSFSMRQMIEESPRPRPQTDSLSFALWGTPVSKSSRRSPRAVDGPAYTASNLVAENAQLRAEVEGLHTALLQTGSLQPRDSAVKSSPLDVEPQLEAALSHSRTRLRTMLRQQLEDSRKLMASLHQDIVEAERRLAQERLAREKCSQQLQLAETAAGRGSGVIVPTPTPTKFRSAGAASSPMPQPPSLPPVTLGSTISDAEDLNSSGSASPLSYGGGAWLA